MTACPSGVDYGKLIEVTRAQIERLAPRPAVEKLHRRMLFSLFPRVNRLRLMREEIAEITPAQGAQRRCVGQLTKCGRV